MPAVSWQFLMFKNDVTQKLDQTYHPVEHYI